LKVLPHLVAWGGKGSKEKRGNVLESFLLRGRMVFTLITFQRKGGVRNGATLLKILKTFAKFVCLAQAVGTLAPSQTFSKPVLPNVRFNRMLKLPGTRGPVILVLISIASSTHPRLSESSS
jgi:hypothetical protein